jgi:hypothetical protein
MEPLLASTGAPNFGGLGELLLIITVGAGVSGLAAFALLVGKWTGGDTAAAYFERYFRWCLVLPAIWLAGFVLLVARG